MDCSREIGGMSTCCSLIVRMYLQSLDHSMKLEIAEVFNDLIDLKIGGAELEKTEKRSESLFRSSLWSSVLHISL